jgi:hypothetical protein
MAECETIARGKKEEIQKVAVLIVLIECRSAFMHCIAVCRFAYIGLFTYSSILGYSEDQTSA